MTDSKKSLKVMNPLDRNYIQLNYNAQLILDVGRLLMENASDTSRIVRSMKRTAAFLGIFGDQINIHITYTTIMISISVGDYHLTKLQKCHHHNVDMNVISEVSNLSWTAIEQDYTPKQFRKELDRIEFKKRKYASAIITIGAAVACGGVGKMFGCDIVASIYTAIAAGCGFFMRRYTVGLGINAYMCIAIASFVATTVAYILHNIYATTTPYYALLGSAIFIIPGIPLINAMEDMMDTYITAGMTRAINATLMIGAMTFGIVFAIWIFAVNNFTSFAIVTPQSYWIIIISSALGAVGFSIMFDVPPRLLWVVCIGGIIAVCTRNLSVEYLGVGTAVGTLLGAMVVSVLSLRCSYIFEVPSHVVSVPSVIPLMPGLFMYRLLFDIIYIDKLNPVSFLHAFQSGVTAILVVMAIAVGVAIPNIFMLKYLEKNTNRRLSHALAERKYRQYKKRRLEEEAKKAQVLSVDNRI